MQSGTAAAIRRALTEGRRLKMRSGGAQYHFGYDGSCLRAENRCITQHSCCLLCEELAGDKMGRRTCRLRAENIKRWSREKAQRGLVEYSSAHYIAQ